MLRRRILWIILPVLIVLAGGSYAAYRFLYVPSRTTQPTYQTATVTRGTVSITADGSGTLVAPTTLNLAFSSSGTLAELHVRVGDKVSAGDVLARIDDTAARQAVADAQLQVRQATDNLASAKDTTALVRAVEQAKISVAQAEASHASAQFNLDQLLNWTPDQATVESAQMALDVAEANYQTAVAQAKHRGDQLTSSQVSLDEAIGSLQDAQTAYVQAMDSARDFDPNVDASRAAAAAALERAQENLRVSQASYNLASIDTTASAVESARASVFNAQTSLDTADTPPDETQIEPARVSLQQSELSLRQSNLNLQAAQAALDQLDTTQAEVALDTANMSLEAAQRALTQTTLTAPIAGTVTQINALVDEEVSGTFIVLADLDAPQIEFWVQETDMSDVAVDHAVSIVFNGLPDLTFSGKILQVDPMLVTVSGVSAVQAWASIDTTTAPSVTLLGGMNADVTVIAAEARNVLIVPVEALRSLGQGRYGVFVVQANNQLELRPVEVGLIGLIDAEIRSGLQEGEVVLLSATTGTQTSTFSSSSGSSGRGGGGFRFPGGG
ncbi:MAG: efflux RND transporter periplasmic adaptor subunit [Anaerolineae bacterium]